MKSCAPSVCAARPWRALNEPISDARGPSRCPPHFVCLPGAARWPLCSPPTCRQPRGSLPGWGKAFFLLDWPVARTRATKHEAAHAETEAVAEDGRCCMRARCVITEHLADRRKSPVWSSEATYLRTGQCSRCAGRAIRGPDVRWSASLNRHKIWPDCENGHVKEGWAGLKTLCQRMGRNAPCRGLHLELRPRPMSREHARPQPPAASRR
jgi:hypothetical protein